MNADNLLQASIRQRSQNNLLDAQRNSYSNLLKQMNENPSNTEPNGEQPRLSNAILLSELNSSLKARSMLKNSVVANSLIQASLLDNAHPKLSTNHGILMEELMNKVRTASLVENITNSDQQDDLVKPTPHEKSHENLPNHFNPSDPAPENEYGCNSQDYRAEPSNDVEQGVEIQDNISEIREMNCLDLAKSTKLPDSTECFNVSTKNSQEQLDHEKQFIEIQGNVAEIREMNWFDLAKSTKLPDSTEFLNDTTRNSTYEKQGVDIQGHVADAAQDHVKHMSDLFEIARTAKLPDSTDALNITGTDSQITHSTANVVQITQYENIDDDDLEERDLPVSDTDSAELNDATDLDNQVSDTKLMAVLESDCGSSADVLSNVKLIQLKRESQIMKFGIGPEYGDDAYISYPITSLDD
jgi:hypothetical protein